MAEESTVEFIEEWQRGVFLLFGTAAVGVVTGVLVGSMTSAMLGLLSFLLGAILAFLAMSYGLYGR
ncbi:hypothetical protein BRD11_00655 [Halobacteriales archaeon SW_12_69_24]|nr:MAG: hypothetical protein BRD11_00655 [Halobacteriales archaeon SW_12_69_24]